MSYGAFANVDPKNLAQYVPPSGFSLALSGIATGIEKGIQTANKKKKAATAAGINQQEQVAMSGSNGMKDTGGEGINASFIQKPKEEDYTTDGVLDENAFTSANEQYDGQFVEIDGVKYIKGAGSEGVLYRTYDTDGDGEFDITDADYYDRPDKDDEKYLNGDEFDNKAYRKDMKEWRRGKRHIRKTNRQDRRNPVEVAHEKGDQENEDNVNEIADAIKFNELKRGTQKKLVKNMAIVQQNMPYVGQNVVTTAQGPGFVDTNSKESKFVKYGSRNPANIKQIIRPDGTIGLRVFAPFEGNEPVKPDIKDYGTQEEYEVALGKYNEAKKTYDEGVEKGGEWIEIDASKLQPPPQKSQFKTEKAYNEAMDNWNATGGGLWAANSIQKTGVEQITAIGKKASKLPGGNNKENFFLAGKAHLGEGNNRQQAQGLAGRIITQNGGTLDYSRNRGLDTNNDNVIDAKDIPNMTDEQLLTLLAGQSEALEGLNPYLAADKAVENSVPLIGSIIEGNKDAATQILNGYPVEFAQGKPTSMEFDPETEIVTYKFANGDDVVLDLSTNEGKRDLIVAHGVAGDKEYDPANVMGSLQGNDVEAAQAAGNTQPFIVKSGDEEIIYDSDAYLGGEGANVITLFGGASIKNTTLNADGTVTLNVVDGLVLDAKGKPVPQPVSQTGGVFDNAAQLENNKYGFYYFKHQETNGVENPTIPPALIDPNVPEAAKAALLKKLLSGEEVTEEELMGGSGDEMVKGQSSNEINLVRNEEEPRTAGDTNNIKVPGLNDLAVSTIMDVSTTGANKEIIANGLKGVDLTNVEAVNAAIDKMDIPDDIKASLKKTIPQTSAEAGIQTTDQNADDNGVPLEHNDGNDLTPKPDWDDSRLNDYNIIANSRARRAKWEADNPGKTYPHAYEDRKKEEAYVRKYGKLPGEMFARKEPLKTGAYGTNPNVIVKDDTETTTTTSTETETTTNTETESTDTSATGAGEEIEITMESEKGGESQTIKFNTSTPPSELGGEQVLALEKAGFVWNEESNKWENEKKEGSVELKGGRKIHYKSVESTPAPVEEEVVEEEVVEEETVNRSDDPVLAAADENAAAAAASNTSQPTAAGTPSAVDVPADKVVKGTVDLPEGNVDTGTNTTSTTTNNSGDTETNFKVEGGFWPKDSGDPNVIIKDDPGFQATWDALNKSGVYWNPDSGKWERHDSPINQTGSSSDGITDSNDSNPDIDSNSFLASNEGSNALRLIKKEEGFRGEAYQDSGGLWTIGHGITTYEDGTPVKKGDKVSEKRANQLLAFHTKKAYDNVMKFNDKYNWNAEELEALMSFAYNIGSINQLTKNGTRSKQEIAKAMLQYDKVNGKPNKAIANRRKRESIIFLSGGTKPLTA